MCDVEEIHERAKKQRQVMIDAVKEEAVKRVQKRQADGLLNDKKEIQKAIMEEEIALESEKGWYKKSSK